MTGPTIDPNDAPRPETDWMASAWRPKVADRPPVAFAAAPEAPTRLNVVLPNYFKNYAFGGVTSAMELAGVLAGPYDEVRFVSQAPLGSREEMFDFASFIQDAHAKTLSAFSVHADALPCHEKEIFLCTHWSTALLQREYSRRLTSAGFTPNPFHYFIQDFEPGFYPYGEEYAQCLATYSRPEQTHAIFNSRELADHFDRLGLVFPPSPRRTTLLPSLNPVLLERLRALDFKLRPKPEGKTIILVYGRPGHHRNCFGALMEGLHRFFAPLPPRRREEFAILSAGKPHEDIRLHPGAVVRSLGKLPLEGYVAALESAHVGISLMASPHPSYPPLEMATFGLQTITNRFGGKDLDGVHPLLFSLSGLDPEELAAELGRAVQRLRAQDRRRPGRAELPSNMSPLPWRANLEAAALPTLESPNASGGQRGLRALSGLSAPGA